MDALYSANLLKFNQLINPQDKAIYYYGRESELYTMKFLGNIYNKPIFLTVKEIIDSLDSNLKRNFHVDLSQVGIVYIDSDSAQATQYLKEQFEGLSYILNTSLKEGRAHFYFKKSEFSRPFYNKTYWFSLYDYYKLGGFDPYGPIMPRPENGRHFVTLPDHLDLMPQIQ